MYYKTFHFLTKSFSSSYFDKTKCSAVVQRWKEPEGFIASGNSIACFRWALIVPKVRDRLFGGSGEYNGTFVSTVFVVPRGCRNHMRGNQHSYPGKNRRVRGPGCAIIRRKCWPNVHSLRVPLQNDWPARLYIFSIPWEHGWSYPHHRVLDPGALLDPTNLLKNS